MSVGSINNTFTFRDSVQTVSVFTVWTIDEIQLVCLDRQDLTSNGSRRSLLESLLIFRAI